MPGNQSRYSDVEQRRINVFFPGRRCQYGCSLNPKTLNAYAKKVKHLRARHNEEVRSQGAEYAFILVDRETANENDNESPITENAPTSLAQMPVQHLEEHLAGSTMNHGEEESFAEREPTIGAIDAASIARDTEARHLLNVECLPESYESNEDSFPRQFWDNVSECQDIAFSVRYSRDLIDCRVSTEGVSFRKKSLAPRSTVWHLAWNTACIHNIKTSIDPGFELLNEPNSDGISPLLYHLMTDNVDVVKALLKLSDVQLTWDAPRPDETDTHDFCLWRYGNALHAYLKLHSNLDIIDLIYRRDKSLATARSRDGGKTVLMMWLEESGESITDAEVKKFEWMIKHVKHGHDDNGQHPLHVAKNPKAFVKVTEAFPFLTNTPDFHGTLPDLEMGRVADEQRLTRFQNAIEKFQQSFRRFWATPWFSRTRRPNAESIPQPVHLNVGNHPQARDMRSRH
jgi:hypothetical protein